MTCPYREWHILTNNWICKFAFQDCPEGYFDDFQYKECSTYREHEENKMRELLEKEKKKEVDKHPIEVLEKILDLIWEVEKNLNYEHLLGHARDYIEITIRELKEMIK